MIKRKRNFCLTIQLVLLVLFIFLAKVSTNKEMSTVSNNASNRIINLSTMALKLEEDLPRQVFFFYFYRIISLDNAITCAVLKAMNKLLIFNLLYHKD